MEALKRSGVKERFPHLTSRSLHLRVMEHRYYTSQRLGHDPRPDAVLTDFAHVAGTWNASLGRIAHLGRSLVRELRVPLNALLQRRRS